VKRGLALVLGCLALSLALPEGVRGAQRRRRVAKPVSLVWHVETLEGQVTESNQADDDINPASVVKVATSLWALERLGPGFRYETRFLANGTVDEAKRVLRGDLVVQGSGDPDFHPENAFLVAQALNDLHIERVTGLLVVNRRFWMGWENGSQGREPDPIKRGIVMASRLRQALNPRRWDGLTRMTWREFALRRGLDARRPPQVIVAGGIGADGELEHGEMLVVHRSQTLGDTLRRFNCFSNNDIERVAASIGSTDEFAAFVADRCGVARDAVHFETTSGLGTNRLSPRMIVHLLRVFRQTCERLAIPVESLLPVAGCESSTVTRQFPLLADGPTTASVVGKTGTLTNTDGGVAVLAGFARTAQGELIFCVAAPRAAGKLKGSRHAEEKWLLELLGVHGGAQARQCAPELPTPDVGATVILLGDRVIPPQANPTASAVPPSASTPANR
jgi:D-alanyl-D-alanine carboxypeptidase/D-alanyl-D-alanine-endopeptidase (penicillin-binding protein 4)